MAGTTQVVGAKLPSGRGKVRQGVSAGLVRQGASCPANILGFVNIEQILTQAQDLMATYGQMSAAGAADTTATTYRVLTALKNATRMGFSSEADDEGIFTHVLLEVR